MTTRTITAYEHTCMRCGFVWESLLKDPKVCRKCNNPGWKTLPTGKRGRPRTLPAELRDDVTRYNREYARKRRGSEKKL